MYNEGGVSTPEIFRRFRKGEILDGREEVAVICYGNTQEQKELEQEVGTNKVRLEVFDATIYTTAKMVVEDLEKRVTSGRLASKIDSMSFAPAMNPIEG